jgi:hypothetical protein
MRALILMGVFYQGKRHCTPSAVYPSTAKCSNPPRHLCLRQFPAAGSPISTNLIQLITPPPHPISALLFLRNLLFNFAPFVSKLFAFKHCVPAFASDLSSPRRLSKTQMPSPPQAISLQKSLHDYPMPFAILKSWATPARECPRSFSTQPICFRVLLTAYRYLPCFPYFGIQPKANKGFSSIFSNQNPLFSDI